VVKVYLFSRLFTDFFAWTIILIVGRYSEAIIIRT